MQTILEFFWQKLNDPWFIVITTTIIISLFFLFKKTLRLIPFLVMLAMGILIGSMLPSFILQYHHQLSGEIKGQKKSIRIVEKENAPIRVITKLEESLEESKETLKEFDKAKGFEMYKVFFSNIEIETLKETKKRYSPAIVLNSYGYLGILIGAIFGIIFWAILKILVSFHKKGKFSHK